MLFDHPGRGIVMYLFKDQFLTTFSLIKLCKVCLVAETLKLLKNNTKSKYNKQSKAKNI